MSVFMCLCAGKLIEIEKSSKLNVRLKKKENKWKIMCRSDRHRIIIIINSMFMMMGRAISNAINILEEKRWKKKQQLMQFGGCFFLPRYIYYFIKTIYHFGSFKSMATFKIVPLAGMRKSKHENAWNSHFWAEYKIQAFGTQI